MRWTTEETNVQVDDLELWCCTITPGRTTKRLTSRRTSYVYGCRLKRRPAARWGRRIRRNSIRNCFHDDIIGVNLNIWWDRRGFVHIDYICWNFKFRWKKRCRKTGRTFQLSAPLSTVVFWRFLMLRRLTKKAVLKKFPPCYAWGNFHIAREKRNDRRKFLEYSDIIQISRLLRESERSWNWK